MVYGISWSKAGLMNIIRNIWAVGRNYRDHAKELGNEIPKIPLIFLKAGSCVVRNRDIVLPIWATNIHYELEIALQWDENLQIHQAALALDLTERDQQLQAKNSGTPWTMAKSFKGACPVSEFFPIKDLSELKNIGFKLWINDELKQAGNTQDMVFTTQELSDYVKKIFPVEPFDLLLTGTPAGVGPLKPGDQLRAEIEKFITVNWQVS